MAKITEGEWEFSGAVYLVGDPNSPAGAHNLWWGEVRPDVGDGPYRGPICTILSCDHIDGISREEAEANARAISLLPRMVGILEQLEMYARVQVRSHPDSTDTTLWQSVLDVLAEIEGDE